MTAKENERCAIQIDPSRSIKIVPEQNEEHLNERDANRWEICWTEYDYRRPCKIQGTYLAQSHLPIPSGQIGQHSRQYRL
jgi:hypothetical protein